MSDNSAGDDTDGARLLESARETLAGWLELGNRPQVTVDEWTGFGAEEKRAFWAGRVTAPNGFPGWRAMDDQIRTLGTLRYAPAVPLLAGLREGCPVLPVRMAASHALFTIGTSEARAVLRAGIDSPERLDRFMAAKTMFTDEGSAWDNAGWLFSDDRLSEDSGIATASSALEFVMPSSYARAGAQWRLDDLRDLLARDERWLDVCVRLRDHDSLGWQARLALEHADSAVTGPALDAAAAARKAQARPRAPHLAPGSLAERYQRGEHQAVWRELGAVDPLDGTWRAEAEQVATLTMERVRTNAERLVTALIANGWPVDPGQALPGSEPDIEDHLQRLEELTGVPVPPALAAYWRIVGPVDLVPRDYWEKPFPAGVPEELAIADPLEVGGLGEASYGVEEWQRRRDRMHPEIAGPLRIEFAADFLHKANISGGAPYGIWLPCTAADPLVREEDHALNFTGYLRLAFAGKGFTRVREARERQHGDSAQEPPSDMDRWLAAVEYEHLDF